MEVSTSNRPAGITGGRTYSANAPAKAEQKDGGPAIPTDKLDFDLSKAGEMAGDVAHIAGKGLHSVLRAGTGAVSLALHAPQVTLGPLFTRSAKSKSDAGGAGSLGYAAAGSVFGGGAGFGIGEYFGVGTGWQLAFTGVGLVVGAFALGAIKEGNNDSFLGKAALRKHEAYNEIEGTGAQKLGYSIAQGYRSAIGNYYENGAQVADGLVAFTTGLAGAKPAPRE